MTHEELLAHIDAYLIPTMEREPGPQNAAIGILKAFRSVIELHEPGDYGHNSWQACLECSCQECNTVVVWPCATITTVKRELS